MVDELIREITEPQDDASPAARSAARERLLAAADGTARTGERKRLRLGGRGLALIAALLAVPAGVAVATELSHSGGEPMQLADCPELQAALAAKPWNPEGLELLACPTGHEVARTVSMLALLRAQSAALEARTESKHVTVVGTDKRGPWALDGIAGPIDSSKPIAHRPRP